MLSVKPWKLEAVGRLCLCIIGTVCMGMLLHTFILALIPAPSDDARSLVMGLVTLFLQAGVLAWIGFFLWEANISWSEAFGLRSGPLLRVVFLGLITALSVLPLAWGVQQLSLLGMKLMHWTPESQEIVQKLQEDGLTMVQKILFGIMSIVAAPVVEECVFRGIIYPTVKQIGYPKLAFIGTSILFAISHANALTFLPLAILSMVLIFLYEQTDNLLAPIVAHSVFNTVNFLVLIFINPISRILNLE